MGIPIVISPLAVSIKRHAVIARSRIKKRRRGWTLSYTNVETPCAWKMVDPLTGRDVLVVHPSIAERIRNLPAAPERPPKSPSFHSEFVFGHRIRPPSMPFMLNNVV